MKYLSLVVLLLGMTACAKAAPPPKAVEAPIHNASVEDCEHVYGRVLAISLSQQIDPDKSYSKDELEAGVILLDQMYAESGKKKMFFGYCTTQLNVNQATCMLNAESFESMDLCDKLFKTKK